jgi:hypothetical protein
MEWSVSGNGPPGMEMEWCGVECERQCLARNGMSGVECVGGNGLPGMEWSGVELSGV